MDFNLGWYLQVARQRHGILKLSSCLKSPVELESCQYLVLMRQNLDLLEFGWLLKPQYNLLGVAAEPAGYRQVCGSVYKPAARLDLDKTC